MASTNNLESCRSASIYDITLFEDPLTGAPAPTKLRRKRQSSSTKKETSSATINTSTNSVNMEELLLSATKAKISPPKRRLVYSERLAAQLKPCTAQEMAKLHSVNSLYYLRDKQDIEAAGELMR